MRGGSQPFHRAAAQFALIRAAMALTDIHERAKAIDGVPVYVSHGKRATKRHDCGGTARHQRAALKARNVARNRRAHQ